MSGWLGFNIIAFRLCLNKWKCYSRFIYKSDFKMTMNSKIMAIILILSRILNYLNKKCLWLHISFHSQCFLRRAHILSVSKLTAQQIFPELMSMMSITECITNYLLALLAYTKGVCLGLIIWSSPLIFSVSRPEEVCLIKVLSFIFLLFNGFPVPQPLFTPGLLSTGVKERLGFDLLAYVIRWLQW